MLPHQVEAIEEHGLYTADRLTEAFRNAMRNSEVLNGLPLDKIRQHIQHIRKKK